MNENLPIDDTAARIERGLLRAVTRRLPRVKGAGFLANKLRELHIRKKRGMVEAGVLGFRFVLDLSEAFDSALFFYPQLVDYREVAFLEAMLREGDRFVDLGAHIGFYSLVASRRVGRTGRVLSVEAAPDTFARLLRHTLLNSISNVTLLNVGVSDRTETLPLGLDTSGNRGGNSFLSRGDTSIDVPCRPLLDLLREQAFERVDLMKLDIEGFEYRVLRRFLEDAPRDLYPHAIIIEYQPRWVEAAGGDSLAVLKDCGYRIHRKGSLNYLLVR